MFFRILRPSGRKKLRPPKKKTGGTRSTVSKINQDIQKDTLGDLEALSALKEQMEGGKKAAPKKAKAEEPVAEVKEEKAKTPAKAEEVPAKEKPAEKAEEKAEEVKEEKAEAAEEVKEEKPKKKAAPKAKKEEAPEADASEETTEEDK